MAQNNEPNQKAGTGLVIAGFIFAFLGGLIGVAIGAYINMGKVTNEQGEKELKFDEDSRKKGKIILIISIVAIVFWNIIRFTM